MKRIGSIALRLLATFFVFDLIGVAAAFVFDIMPSRLGSPMLAYALWFVIGVFSGFLGYSFAGAGKAKTEDPNATRTSLLVISVSVILIAAMSALFYITMWRGGVASGSYVPDNILLTGLFFGAALVSMILAHRVFRPDAKP